MKNLFLLCLSLLFVLNLSAQTSAGDDLRVFPNPVMDRFEIPANDQVGTIRVVNMVGREVRKFAVAARASYDIADLPRGMYLVQLRDRQDKVIHTQRVKKG